MPGFKFLRKTLEYDYNPSNTKVTKIPLDAENALKAFCDISVKQMNQMKISCHIGNKNSNCKNDALWVLHKYIQRNCMNEQIIQFMLDDKVAFEEYNSYKYKKSSSISHMQKRSIVYSPFDERNLSDLTEGSGSSTKSSDDIKPNMDPDELYAYCLENKNKWKNMVSKHLFIYVI